MTAFICITCGTQYPPSNTPPARCQVCEDERQYVNWQGQQWTAMDRLGADHRNVFRDEGPGLTGIRTEPEFAIGQQTLLVQTAQGNILWDSISYLDDATIETVRRLGGISAICISHPHFYSSMVEWARAFNAPMRRPFPGFHSTSLGRGGRWARRAPDRRHDLRGVRPQIRQLHVQLS